jgi:hypothetical protein
MSGWGHPVPRRCELCGARHHGTDCTARPVRTTHDVGMFRLRAVMRGKLLLPLPPRVRGDVATGLMREGNRSLEGEGSHDT